MIEEARRPGFVTADPGFDSVVAGSRTSRGRQPDSVSSSVAATAIPRSKARGRGHQRGAAAGGGRRSSRESDSASVADDTGDEGGKDRRRGKGGGGGGSVDGDSKEGKRRGAVSRRKGGKTGGGRRGSGKNHALSEAESVEIGDSSGRSSGEEKGEEEEEEDAASQNASANEGGPERRGGKKRKIPVGKGKKRAKEETDDSSGNDTRCDDVFFPSVYSYHTENVCAMRSFRWLLGCRLRFVQSMLLRLTRDCNRAA